MIAITVAVVVGTKAALSSVLQIMAGVRVISLVLRLAVLVAAMIRTIFAGLVVFFRLVFSGFIATFIAGYGEACHGLFPEVVGEVLVKAGQP